MDSLINIFAVKWYGESEFWLALGKVILILGLILYTYIFPPLSPSRFPFFLSSNGTKPTDNPPSFSFPRFITMQGGNPLHDRFGFRYWRDPGAFAPLYKTGSLGRFLGFLQCLIQASFTISGPDYVSMAAGEAENPRVVMPKAYNAVFYRLTAFFVLGSLAIGINVPYTDQELMEAFDSGAPGAAASPYVVAMNRLRITVMPDIVNALVLSASFSAGNSYVYCASRSLFGLALEGKAPKIFTRCTRNGVPIYCVALVLLISLLSFLQVSNSSAVVLSWFVNLVGVEAFPISRMALAFMLMVPKQVTASQLINFSVMSYTFICFRNAYKVQGLSRDCLPYKGFGQPYIAWYALTATFTMTFVSGYTVFLGGQWSVPTFLFSYTMIAVFPILFVAWKLLKRTKWLKPSEVDLYRDVEEIEEYQRNYVPSPPR